jgi:hypothetical protein
MREAEVGQCKACEYGREITSSHRSTFWRCDRSLTDPSFLKYPRLPVLNCRGYEPRVSGEA